MRKKIFNVLSSLIKFTVILTTMHVVWFVDIVSWDPGPLRLDVQNYIPIATAS